jgi:hypothetical protein
MDNVLKKAEFIRKAVEAYETDHTLNMRDAAVLYRYLYQSIHNRLTEKNKSAPNTFIFQQTIWPVEESVLVEYCIRSFKTDFPIRIQYFNVYVNKLLNARDSDETVDFYWYNSFFKRHPEVKSKFSRLINRRRLNAVDSNKFIQFFRRCINAKNEYSIADLNIDNINELESAINIK